MKVLSSSVIFWTAHEWGTKSVWQGVGTRVFSLVAPPCRSEFLPGESLPLSVFSGPAGPCFLPPKQHFLSASRPQPRKEGL